MPNEHAPLSSKQGLCVRCHQRPYTDGYLCDQCYHTPLRDTPKPPTPDAAARHTPGPWKYVRGEEMPSGAGRYFPSVFIGKHQPQIGVNAGGGPMEEHEANAQLIASAPDMASRIAALEGALRGLHKAADSLLARVITLDPTFMPSRSPEWPAFMASATALASPARAEGGAFT